MQQLTHWGRVTHICVSKLTIIGSDNGLSPGRRQAIIWTNAGTLLIRPLGTNFSEFFVEILIFSFKKMRLKVSYAKWQPYCLGLNVLKDVQPRYESTYQGWNKMAPTLQATFSSAFSWHNETNKKMHWKMSANISAILLEPQCVNSSPP